MPVSAATEIKSDRCAQDGDYLENFQGRGCGEDKMSGPFIKMVAQFAVQGIAVVGRAMITAYQQALQNAKAGGGAAAAASNLVKRKMASDEAMKILNIETREELTVETVKQLYKRHYEANDPKKGGSFYLQSKIYRAREALEMELDPERRSGEKENEVGQDKSEETNRKGGNNDGDGSTDTKK